MIKDKVIEFFSSKLKSELPELENVYIPTRTVDANKDATFNERTDGLKEFKRERLEQLTLKL